jgi:hypothetical protein
LGKTPLWAEFVVDLKQADTAGDRVKRIVRVRPDLRALFRKTLNLDIIPCKASDYVLQQRLSGLGNLF